MLQIPWGFKLFKQEITHRDDIAHSHLCLTQTKQVSLIRQMLTEDFSLELTSLMALPQQSQNRTQEDSDFSMISVKFLEADFV